MLYATNEWLNLRTLVQLDIIRISSTISHASTVERLGEIVPVHFDHYSY